MAKSNKNWLRPLGFGGKQPEGFNASAGGGGSEPKAEGDSPEYVTKADLDGVVAKIMDRLDSMAPDDEGPEAEAPDDETPEASADESETAQAATAEAIVAAIPAAPKSFVATCVSARMSMDQVNAFYAGIAKSESQSAIGSARPLAGGRRGGAAAPVAGTAEGFAARVSRIEQSLLAGNEIEPGKARGTAISRAKAEDPDGYVAWGEKDLRRFNAEKFAG